jgi:hypothetical protein
VFDGVKFLVNSFELAAKKLLLRGNPFIVGDNLRSDVGIKSKIPRHDANQDSDDRNGYGETNYHAFTVYDFYSFGFFAHLLLPDTINRFAHNLVDLDEYFPPEDEAGIPVIEKFVNVGWSAPALLNCVFT